MRKAILVGATAILVVWAAEASLAMGGGGGSAPGASPYRILQPQTVVPLTSTHNDLKSDEPEPGSQKPALKYRPAPPPKDGD